jgi:hypothetical protein
MNTGATFERTWHNRLGRAAGVPPLGGGGEAASAGG